jgi:hypothetical protein
MTAHERLDLIARVRAAIDADPDLRPALDAGWARVRGEDADAVRAERGTRWSLRVLCGDLYRAGLPTRMLTWGEEGIEVWFWGRREPIVLRPEDWR